MPQPKPVKICLVGQSLASGGAEKAMGELSIFFAPRGIEVSNVIVLDEIAYPFAGGLLNLGKLKRESNDIFDKARRFLALRKFLVREKFDCIIDFRIRVSFLQEWFIAKTLYNAPVYYTVHSSILPLYFPRLRWSARAVYAKADGIVVVSDGIRQAVESAFALGNVSVIPNAVDLDDITAKALEPITVRDRFIVAAGRMDDDVKQFDKLISAFKESELPNRGMKLVLLGDGKLRPKLESDAGPHVIFKGFVSNPYAYFSKADFFVLSSKREGLPMVILESLACGTPVISFDCRTGPRELIRDGENGLLVRDQDFEALASGMNRLASDKELYDQCKSNATIGIQDYSIQKIGQRWLSYLKINVS